MNTNLKKCYNKTVEESRGAMRVLRSSMYFLIAYLESLFFSAAESSHGRSGRDHEIFILTAVGPQIQINNIGRYLYDTVGAETHTGEHYSTESLCRRSVQGWC